MVLLIAVAGVTGDEGGGRFMRFEMQAVHVKGGVVTWRAHGLAERGIRRRDQFVDRLAAQLPQQVPERDVKGLSLVREAAFHGQQLGDISAQDLVRVVAAGLAYTETGSAIAGGQAAKRDRHFNAVRAKAGVVARCSRSPSDQSRGFDDFDYAGYAHGYDCPCLRAHSAP